MVRFDLRLLNFPAERLFMPRKRLAPLAVPDYVKEALLFKDTGIKAISEESDVIIFVDYFSRGFDNFNDIKEYILSHEFFNLTKDTDNKDGITKVITTLKYLFASKRVLQGLVTDDTVFSFHLPYLAEASYDLECSVDLIYRGYFKQSLQILRNVIEVTLTHAYYTLNDMDYHDVLEADEHRIPPVKDIIRFLRKENLLTPEMERKIFELYKTLSSAVHSEIKKLNTGGNSATYTGFLEWYEAFVSVSQMHFKIIIRMIEIGI